MYILANDGISPSGKLKLEQNGHIVSTDTIAQENLLDEINSKSIDVLLVRSATTIRKDIIDNCPSLKMIGRGGVGMDNIDADYARSKGKLVFNTPASSSQSVAEMVFAHLFGMARGLYDANRKMPQTGVSDFKTLKKLYGKGKELRGKTMGIIGFGRIGQSTASYALGIGMKVLAADRFVQNVTISLNINDQNIDIDINTTSIEDVLKNADFISLHVPKQADGSAVISDKEIEMMKDGVYLINLARGGVIDEDTLIKGLDSGKISAASLDVYENEPQPRADLLGHAKISLSPHVGAATLEAQDRIGTELADFIIANV